MTEATAMKILCITIIILMIGLRGVIVCVIRLRALDALHEKNLKLITDRKYTLLVSLSEVNEKSFFRMCMMLNKWTVNQFYPFIKDKEK